MIRRINEEHLDNVSGGGKRKCLCGTVCPCTDDVDGAASYIVYTADAFNNFKQR